MLTVGYGSYLVHGSGACTLTPTLALKGRGSFEMPELKVKELYQLLLLTAWASGNIDALTLKNLGTVQRVFADKKAIPFACTIHQDNQR